MQGLVSTNYRQLEAAEIEQVAAECVAAWQNPELPERQYQMAVKHELEGFRVGRPVAPFDAFVKCLRRLPLGVLMNRPSFLDVGASGGYYSEIIRHAGFRFEYRACDFSQAFRKLAQHLYPGIAFDIADARALPYAENSYEILLHAACLMHTFEYEKAISEAARVAKRYVIFHRTPIYRSKQTTFFQKDAYGVPCLEIHFNEDEFLKMCDANGLFLCHTESIFWNAAEDFGHCSYVFEKIQVEPYASDKNV